MPGMTPLTYQVLLALADGSLHGYGIIKEIEGRADVESVPSTGALYLALQRMTTEGLIQEAKDRPEGGDARRRYYALTHLGRQRAEEESARLASLVAAARAKNLLTGGAS